MEKKLGYSMMISLKEISLRRVAVILWSKSEILASFDESAVKDKVKDDISKLGLPPLLTKQINYFVTPIESELRNWKLFHENYLNISRESFDMKLLEKLHWTILGTVNYRKTAENLIRLKMLYVHQRYRLACLYCLEDYIPVLWGKLPEWRRRYFYKEEPFDYGTLPPLEYCWPYILKGEETKLDNVTERTTGYQTTFNKYAFECSARKGNKAAAEYFFRKLTSVERESSLIRTTQAALKHRLKAYSFCLLEEFSKENLSETICYVLSLMGPEMQMEIYKQKPYNVLTCFLDWPMQDLFQDAAEVIFPFLTAIDYVVLLWCITVKIESSYRYAKLFHEFFVRGTNDFKRYFVDKEGQDLSMLRQFFDFRDSETIKVIFTNLDSDDRKRLVSKKCIFILFFESIMKGDSHLVELCLQEASLSKVDKEELKGVYCDFFMETNIISSDDNLKDYIWQQFLQFLDKN